MALSASVDRVRLALAADHAGYELKQRVAARLVEADHEIVDRGCHAKTSVDYVDFTLAAVRDVVDGVCERAILFCGNGYAMAMLANKFPGVRAVVAHDVFTARTAVEMGAANVLSLGARVVGADVAEGLVDTWVRARFASDVPRYSRRLERVEELEQELAAPDWRAVLERRVGR